jgi:hypothetical protein
MAKLSAKKVSATHRVIVYGASFSGKSLLTGKLAEHYNLIWVDMEKGSGVLYQLPESYQERIEIVDLPDTRSYPIAIETMLKLVKGPVAICEAHGKVGCMVCKRELASQLTEESTESEKELAYHKSFIDVDVNSMDNDTILVIDTLTQLSNSAITNITKNQPDDYKLQHDDWGKLGKLLDIVLSHIQQASYNVVVISHENEVQTEGKKTTLAPTGGTRNFSRNITKYFTDVVYLERKNKKHVALSSTTGSTSVIAGSQTGVELEAMGEPSLLPIFKPELFASTKAEAKPAPSATGKSAASDVLARLRAKKG